MHSSPPVGGAALSPEGVRYPAGPNQADPAGFPDFKFTKEETKAESSELAECGKSQYEIRRLIGESPHRGRQQANSQSSRPQGRLNYRIVPQGSEIFCSGILLSASLYAFSAAASLFFLSSVWVFSDRLDPFPLFWASAGNVRTAIHAKATISFRMRFSSPQFAKLAGSQN
jgi:hypothetical protein